MSRAARTAHTRASRTIPAATGTVPSARAVLPASGSLSARPSCCQCRTCTSYSRSPAALRDIAYRNKAVIYDLLFKVSAETTLAIAADPKHLGARIDFISVLHTWGSALVHHPHVHMIVLGGGLSPDASRWIACRPRYFLTVEVLPALFRALFVKMLLAAHEAESCSSSAILCHSPRRLLSRLI